VREWGGVGVSLCISLEQQVCISILSLQYIYIYITYQPCSGTQAQEERGLRLKGVACNMFQTRKPDTLLS
jgi:hypothetical protein